MSNRHDKILYLCRGGYISGAQRQLLYLLEGLDRDRFTPVVLCTEGGPFLQRLRDMQVPCRLWKCAGWRKLKCLFARYRDAADLSRWAAGESVSLIHCSDFQFSEYLLRSARKTGVPSVLHVRAPIDRQTARKYRCAGATAVVAISRRVELRLAREAGIPAGKIVLIHDAVDPALFRPRDPGSGGSALRQQYDTGDAVLIGIVGRVEPAKEQLAFVRIARQVLEKTDKAAFFIVGETRDASYHAQVVRDVRRDGLTNRVHLTGRREDIVEVLSGLDVLVSLSGGSVRYEAMMCGLPVVCAWSRRPEESVSIRHNETGFLVSERQIEPVTRILLDLIADPSLRERVGHNARAWAQAHLTDSALVAHTQELYEHLLNGQAPHRT
jgi:glycosyltransferase involved in cell wall biosynthesis